MTERGRLVAIEGPSGSGKTAVTRAAARAFGGLALEEAFARLEPPPELRYRTDRELLAIERRLLAEERRRDRSTAELLRRGRTVFADTGFLGPLTYTAGLVGTNEAPPELFRRLRAAAGRPGLPRLPDLTVYLDVPAGERKRRVARDPKGHPADLADRHERVGRFERRFFLEVLPSLDPGRVVRLRAEGSLSTVIRRLGRVLGRAPAARRGPVSASRAVAGLAALLARNRPGRRRSRPAASVKKAARSGRDPSR